MPDRPFEQLAGFRSTRLGFRHRSERGRCRRAIRAGNAVYWIGPAGAGQRCRRGTDFRAVAEGYVSVTPLSIDLTRHAALPDVSTLARAAVSAAAMS